MKAYCNLSALDGPSTTIAQDRCNADIEVPSIDGESYTPTAKISSDFVLSELHVLIEFWYLKIKVVAAQQSLLNEIQTIRAAADRLDYLRKRCIKESRLREARLLTHFRISLRNNNEEKEAILKNFLAVLNGTNHPLEEAQTHLDLATCLMSCDSKNLEAIHSHIGHSKKLFLDEHHEYGLIDIQDLQLSKDVGASGEEVVVKKLSIAESHFKVQCYRNGIRCLLSSAKFSLEMDGVHRQTQRNLERLLVEVTKVGDQLLKQEVFMQLVCQSLVRAPEYGYGLTSLEAYLATVPDEIGPKNHGVLLQCLAMAYFNLGSTSDAVIYAKKALQVFSSGESYVDRSDTALLLACIIRKRAQNLHSTSADRSRWAIESIEILQNWADLDHENSYYEGEQAKCLQLALEDYSYGFSTNTETIDRGTKWFSRAKQCQTTHGIAIPFPDMLRLEIADSLTKGDYDSAFKGTTHLIEAYRTTKQISPSVLGQTTMHVAVTLLARTIHHMENGGEKSDEEWKKIVQKLLESLNISWQAMEFYTASQSSEMIVLCANLVGSQINRIRSLDPSIGDDLLKEYLPEIAKVEQFCDSIRRTLPATDGFHSLLKKRNIVSNSAHRELYEYAVQSCLIRCDPASAWLWIQKGKARALCDLFGARTLLPGRLLQAIRDDPESEKLYEQERLSIERAMQATPEGYIAAARRAETFRMQMKSNPLLARVLEIREGAFDVRFEAQSISTALNLTKIGRQAIKYIDWFITKEIIILLVPEVEGETYCKCLSVTVSEVESWLKEAFDGRGDGAPRLKSGDGNRFLSRLNNLVDGLERYTNATDLLVLSPSGLLNRVPLHGLKVDGRRLIERNLIIYASNAATFRQCQFRAGSQATEGGKILHKAAFLGVYEETSFLDERALIFRNLEKLGEGFSGETRCGSQVTKSVFQECSQKFQWLHYHGHALYTKDDMLRSGLILSSGTVALEEYSSDSSDEFNEKDLSVPEIFDLDLTTNAPHFTIIACDSGTQDIAPGDEPLGVVPALLCAGASSILGCLWPIPSPTGRAFSEMFYSNLHTQKKKMQGNSDFCVLNLAAALRETVLAMAEDTKAPFFWAPFVLHGAWFHVVD